MRELQYSLGLLVNSRLRFQFVGEIEQIRYAFPKECGAKLRRICVTAKSLRKKCLECRNKKKHPQGECRCLHEEFTIFMDMVFFAKLYLGDNKAPHIESTESTDIFYIKDPKDPNKE